MPERIRVGVVGGNLDWGWGAAAHLPALTALPEYEVVAVATTRLETAQPVADAFGIPRAFGSADALVAADDIDLVVVAVRTPAHAEILRAALGTGRHVYCEWPLGVDLDEARSLAQLAADKGVTSMIGLQGWHAPGPRRTRELVAQGTIGTLVSVSLATAGGIGGDYIPEIIRYALDKTTGTTQIIVYGGHTLATLERATGPLAQLAGIVTTANPTVTIIESGEQAEVTSSDQVAVAGYLDNGAVATVNIQGGAPQGLSFSLRIVGTAGTLDVSTSQGMSLHSADWAITLARPDGTSEDVTPPVDDLPNDVPPGPPQNIARMYRELARAIAAGTPASPDFATAVRFHELVDAVQRSQDEAVRVTA